MKTYLALTLFLFSACVDSSEVPDPVFYEDGESRNALEDPLPNPECEPKVPERVGDYCLIDGCNADKWDEPGGGDDECMTAIGDTMACCLNDGVCHRGIRFHGPCLGLAPQPGEICPNDDNGDGMCSYEDAWYTLCPWI